MNNQTGFTLIEIIVVVSLLAAIGGLVALTDFDAWRGYTFRDERDLLISVLQKARSESVNNVCLGSVCSDGQPHGVKILPGKYVIFQGQSYAGRNPAFDEEIEASNSIIPSGITEVVFGQLNGDVSGPGDIIIGDAIRTATISINNEGRINWVDYLNH